MDKLDNIMNDYGFIEIVADDEEHKDDLDPHVVKGLWDKNIHTFDEEYDD